MKPLKIAIDARLPGGVSGGVEQVIMGLLSGLSKIPCEEELFVLCYPDSDAWLKPYIGGRLKILHCNAAGVNEIMSKSKRALQARFPILTNLKSRLLNIFPWAPIRIPHSDGTIEAAGIDLIHFTMQLGFLTDVPSIYHPHDLQHIHLPQFFSKRERKFRTKLYTTLCNQAKLVAVTANFGKKDLEISLGLSPDKVKVIPWAPILSEYQNPSPADLEACRQRLKLPEKFLFYPAQTWPHKNHLAVVESMARLKQKSAEKIYFVSTGRKNEHYPVIEKRARELGISDQIIFPGFVSPLELQCLYKLATGTVIPTLFEAASFPLWEAFYAGCAAACSNVTSLPEQAGDAAIVFDPRSPIAVDEAITKLWNDSELRKTLIARGKARVNSLTWESTAEQFLEQYKKLAKRN